ncbi:hypothetical protein PIB30_074877 [Stylosanthes scabra]|uniref:Uncharacterized protein n=1 Tax=Stylosanthes scabra TaxID=79078 RepID=A0ABU6SR51_9FABA|nr:hypothetical protein [Stylosanthes scabra]
METLAFFSLTSSIHRAATVPPPRYPRYSLHHSSPTLFFTAPSPPLTAPPSRSLISPFLPPSTADALLHCAVGKKNTHTDTEREDDGARGAGCRRRREERQGKWSERVRREKGRATGGCDAKGERFAPPCRRRASPSSTPSSSSSSGGVAIIDSLDRVVSATCWRSSSATGKTDKGSFRS